MKVYPLYLSGEWVTTESSKPVINPATGDPFAEISMIGRDRVEVALEAAHDAFKSWRKLPGKVRGVYLHRIADNLDERKDEIAKTITLENGKPLQQSHAEIGLAVDHLHWFAEEAKRAYGRIVPNQVEGKRHLVIKAPMGVVGAISPWNFPLVLAVRKVAPALAAGCTVVLKPATQTPLCAVAFAECVHAAELPKGTFQLVAGPAPEIAAEFLENRLCRKITFTGSTEVGRLLISGAAKSVKPLSLELGGHAPAIVFEDADLNRSVDAAMIAKFRNTGQSCIASNRIYVQRGIYDRFLPAFVERTKALNVGDGLEEGVDIGPLIDEAGLNKALEHIQDAVAQGARLNCGGERITGRKGFFIQPAVLSDVPHDALCMREETFAPIAPISVFDTEEEVINLANDTIYGLSAYVFTTNLDRAFRVMESLESGMISINDGVPSTSQCPFGGVKQSGWGRELGLEGMEAFLETRHVSMGLEI